MRRFLCLLALGALLWGACQPNAPGGSVTPPTVTSTSTVTAPTPTPPPESAIPVTPEALRGLFIEVWHPWQGAMGQALENQIVAFNALNPWGIQARWRRFSGLSELQSTLKESLKGNERPDVAILLGEQAAYWNEQQATVDLGPYLTDPVYGLGQAEIADFYPALWAQDTIGMQVWGIPAQRSARLLLYNRSWAAELGFRASPSHAEAFREQACAAARALGNGRGGWYLDTHPMTALSWIYAFDGKIVEGQGYHFLQPANLSAFVFLKTLFDDGCSWRHPEWEPIQAFGARQALFITIGMEDLPEVERAFALQENRDAWEVIGFPGKTSFVTYGTSYVLFKTTDANQLAGWLFIRWMLQADVQAAIVKSTGLFPVTRSARERLADYAREHPAWAQAVDQLDQARATPFLASWEQTKWMLGDGFEEIFRRGLESGQIPIILAELDQAVGR